jgi:hypothetical protein
LATSASTTRRESRYRKISFASSRKTTRTAGPEIHYEYEAKQYVKKNEEVKKLQWNGPEIRNGTFDPACVCSKLIRKSQLFKQPLLLLFSMPRWLERRVVLTKISFRKVKERHLSQVVSMSAAFKEYITATHEGIEDADLAYKLGIWHDRLETDAVGAAAAASALAKS